MGALNDLLESLNKSSDNALQVQKRENSTSSETGGSNQEGSTPPLGKLGGKVETPKQKKVNPWKAPTQQNQQKPSVARSGTKGGIRKDSSHSDMEEYKGL